jgi:hypothetical protein
VAQKEYRVRLRGKERRQLSDLARKGVERARVITRARILLLADESPKGPRKTDQQIAETLRVGLRTVAMARRKFSRGRTEVALYDRPRSGHPKKLGDREEAMLTTIACSAAPEGHCRWTLRLLADRMVELGQVDSLSHETVRRTLKKKRSSRGNGSTGALGR